MFTSNVEPDAIDAWLLGLSDQSMMPTQPVQTGRFLPQSGRMPLAPPWTTQAPSYPTEYSNDYALFFDDAVGRSRSFSGPAPGTTINHSQQGLASITYPQEPMLDPRQSLSQSRSNTNTESIASESRDSPALTRTSTTLSAPDLAPEEAFLLQAKDEQKLTWRELADAFQATFSETVQVAALQMRYRRLKRRLQAREDVDLWQDQDNRAFLLAREFWATKKFEIISQKMLDFGAEGRWTPEACALKWAEMEGRMPHYSRRSAGSTQA